MLRVARIDVRGETQVWQPADTDTWLTNLESREGLRLGVKHRTRSASSKRGNEAGKPPEILPPYESLFIDSEALDRFAASEARERARTFLDPDDEAYIAGEQGVAYYYMLGDLPKRCHRVFRLRFVKGLGLPAIAKLLGIKRQTAESDLQRALPIFADKRRKMRREGVVRKRK